MVYLDIQTRFPLNYQFPAFHQGHSQKIPTASEVFDQKNWIEVPVQEECYSDDSKMPNFYWRMSNFKHIFRNKHSLL